MSQSGVLELLSTFSRVMRGQKKRWYLFGILRERSERLNLELIRVTLRRLEEALSRSDLAPLFEAELRRIAGTA